MSTPTKDQAYADAVTAYTAIVDAATTQWEADATLMIQNAITLGQFNVTLETGPNVSMNDVQTYFTNLGYKVWIPRYFRGQPAQLFGYFYEAYWEQKNICHCQAPCSITIVWGLAPIV